MIGTYLMSFKHKDIRNHLTEVVGRKMKYYWAHMIEYEEGGWQAIHHHAPRQPRLSCPYLRDVLDLV